MSGKILKPSMNDIPSAATKAEIAFFIEGLDAPDIPVNTQFAAMAYLGMCRHKYMSHDWIICQFALEESLREICHMADKGTANTIRARIEQTYHQKGYRPTPV